VVHGGDGPDRIQGGPGSDTLDDAARSHQDPDRFSGGDGNDEIYSRDGRRDSVNCGSGRDVAKVDSRDEVASDCERVIRIG
jgi:Ca2+-binding RTX toxin-like protein